MRTKLYKRRPRTIEERITSQDRYKRTMRYIRDHQLNEKPDPSFRKHFSYGVIYD